MKTEDYSWAEITDVKETALDIKTFKFRYSMDALPGQFFLLWIPGVDEKPFGIAGRNENSFTSIIAKVGTFTEKLFQLRSGDKVGIKGPYGKSFRLQGKKICLVAGGYGIGPLTFLASEAVRNNIDVTLIIGAKNKKSIVRPIIKGCKILYSTDDGSFKNKGFATDLFKTELEKSSFDAIYSVGPEKMMKAVAELAKNIPCEVSLERYMKCGVGICGQCCVDETGERMCIEGPVMSGKKALSLKEFGNYHRNATGGKDAL